MKNAKPRIPFSLIVKEAGLDRAARWMPFSAATFFILLVVTCGVCYPGPELSNALMLECSPGVALWVVFGVTLSLAFLEFFGSLLDLLSAWLRLRKVRS